MSRLRAASFAVLSIVFASGALPVPARATDLEEVLREVASENPTIAMRLSMAEAARRRIAPAGSWQNPMLELGVANVPTSGRFDMDPMTMKMVGLAQRVPVFGANRLARRSADRALAAESAAATVTSFELFGSAWRAYADAYFADQLVRHAELHRGVMDRMLETARARYESGRGRLEDVMRAEAERARVFSDIAGFRAEEAVARARLDALRGGERPAGADTLASPPIPSVPVEPGAWTAAVDAQHPRLLELTAQTERYRLAARAARRMAWPDLELRGSYAWRETLEGGVPQDNMWNASVGIMVPLFAGQRERAEGAEMDAMARASDNERRAAELGLREQVTAVHAQALAAERTVRLLADTVLVVQQKSLDASWSAYTAGQSDLWRVFEAAHALYGEELALTRARQQLAASQAQLIAITGRGDLLGVMLPSLERP